MPKKVDFERAKFMAPEGRVSYPHVFEPQEDKKGKKTHDLTLIWDKKTDLTEVKKAILRAMEDTFGADKTKWPKIKMPIRDGDIDRADQDAYKGCWFACFRSVKRPGIVDRDGKTPITAEDQTFYAGCYARVTAFALYYDTEGNRGIRFSLRNIMKTRDGEPLTTSRNAADDFADYGGEAAAPAEDGFDL